MRENSEARHVIVNADDFGLTDGINRGIIEAHERGILTSASLMVRYPAAERAAALASAHPKLSIGLHFDIAEWRYEKGDWKAVYQIVDSHDRAEIEAELRRQIAMFRHLTGRAPTHLDSHQHVHKSEPAREILLRASEELDVPLRACDSLIRHCGDFYGQTAEGRPFPAGVSVSRFIEIIERLESGCTEIGCHPGHADDLDSVYRNERETELRVLCDAETWRALKENEIDLVSFEDFAEKRCRASSYKAGDAQRLQS